MSVSLFNKSQTVLNTFFSETTNRLLLKEFIYGHNTTLPLHYIFSETNKKIFTNVYNKNLSHDWFKSQQMNLLICKSMISKQKNRLNRKSNNNLSANSTKWSNKLKQFMGKLPTNCLIVFDHFVGLALKGLNIQNLASKLNLPI